MKFPVSLAVAFALCAVAAAQVAPTSTPIPYATVQVIEPNDSAAVIAEKAAKVLPRPNQTAWMRLERTFFIHFGPNAFHNVEWGTGREDPSIFNPTALDGSQWVTAVKEGGGNMVIPVVKHHDGFCLWPTRYTEHSVAASPWLNGKGDVFRQVADAAHAQGIKLGVYLSPADLYQLRTNPKNPTGYYGNGSAKLASLIPTDPATFKSDPSKGRTPPAGFKTYSYEVDDYNRYFLNQLYELLTEYGPIYEVWFDGANPDRSVPETYDYAAWYDLIRHLQPNAIIFGKGPDGRWVGNENGIGRTTEWSVIPLPKAPDAFNWPDMTGRDLGSRAKLTPGSNLWWFPAEINVPILYGWFWAPNKRVRTASDLVDIYYQSVGRNGNWLLNLSPDNRGLVPDNQLASLHLMAQVVEETFAKNLATGSTLTADTSNPANAPAQALDNNIDTWWEAAPGQTTATLTLKLPAAATFDVISLQEAVDHRGQRIESFNVDTWNGSDWSVATWNKPDEQTTTIGHKRLLRLNAPVTTDQLRVRITSARLEPTLAEVGLFRQAPMVQPPVISDRDIAGTVSINPAPGLQIVFTTDGSMPTPKSPVYRSAIALPAGGTVNAACIGPDGRIGMIAAKYFSGLSPTGWKVLAVDNHPLDPADKTAANAIDGNPATLWQSPDSSLPHSLAIDMGRELQIAGFSYLPREDRNPAGLIDTYRFETSTDGSNWTPATEGRFANVRNNPTLQEVPFPAVSARYFRLTALTTTNAATTTAAAAEITVVPAKPDPAKK